jgi:hypothetical protein
VCLCDWQSHKLQRNVGNCAKAHFCAYTSCQNRYMNEEFQTVARVAELLGVSKDTVRRLFADEPGVIDLGRHKPALERRRYRVLRIPMSVLDRVLNRKRVK